MIAVRDQLVREGAWGESIRMLLNIHDELLFEIRDDMIEALALPLKETMETIFPSLDVPLRVDVNTGKNWGAMQPYHA
jgi:DNA polymerase I